MSALKQVFVRDHVRYSADRYAPELESFAAWLLAGAYNNKTARDHLFRTQRVLHEIGASPGAALTADSLASGFRKLGRHAPARYRNTLRALSHYLRSTGRLNDANVAAVGPLSAVRVAFGDRLKDVRGLQPATILGYDRWITDFLRRSLTSDADLPTLTTQSIEDYIAIRGQQLSRRTLRDAVKCILAFLEYCYERGLLAHRMEQVDLPRTFREEQPPRALPWPLVRRLLGSVDRSTPIGRRDHALLHLMAYYGLRTGELAHLRVDSVDWGLRTLTVRQTKTMSTLVLPLHERTLRLLADYLQRARPSTTLPWLFLRGKAPAGPMTKYSLSAVFRTRAHRSALPLAQYSSYCLRHAFAMRLFQRGVGIKAIGDLMGHRNLISTGVYLRLHTGMLREVALPVPAFGALQGGAL